MSERSYSRKCGNCREKAVALATLQQYEVEVEHDGRRYPVTISDFVVPRCSHCGHLVIDATAEAEIDRAFHRLAGLLTADEILEHRQSLGLTQAALADALGVSVSTLCRWETGMQIQQRSLDRFLRLYFTSAQVRDLLADRPAFSNGSTTAVLA